MFAVRLAQALDLIESTNPAAWLADQFQQRFDVAVSPTTIEHWMAGGMLPDEAEVEMLAEILRVDTQWLREGK